LFCKLLVVLVGSPYVLSNSFLSIPIYTFMVFTHLSSYLCLYVFINTPLGLSSVINGNKTS
jgi:hypothetical protein